MRDGIHKPSATTVESMTERGVTSPREPWTYHLGVLVHAVRAIVAVHRPGMMGHLDRCENQIFARPDAAIAEILSASFRSCCWAETHRPDDYARFVAALRSLMFTGDGLRVIGSSPIPAPLCVEYWAGRRSRPQHG